MIVNAFTVAHPLSIVPETRRVLQFAKQKAQKRDVFCAPRFFVYVAEYDREVTVKTWGYAVRRSGIYKRKIAVKP